MFYVAIFITKSCSSIVLIVSLKTSKGNAIKTHLWMVLRSAGLFFHLTPVDVIADRCSELEVQAMGADIALHLKLFRGQKNAWTYL